MPNENMTTIAIVGQKGGAGKTTLARVLASAALASKLRVHVIDTDPQSAFSRWYARVSKNGGGALPEDGFHIEVQHDADALAARVDELYEAGETDLVLIDTKGELTEWTGKVMREADRLIMPVMPTPTDIEIQLQTLDFYEDLRAIHPDDFPPLACVLTRVPPNGKRSKAEERSVGEIASQFPIVPTVLVARASYIKMDEEGFLHVLRQRITENPAERLQVKNIEETLSEAVDIFNEVMEFTDEG